MAKTEKADRPLMLKVEDFKQALFMVVNDATRAKNVPCYFIEPILAEVYKEIRSNAQKELAIVRKKVETPNDTETKEE